MTGNLTAKEEQMAQVSDSVYILFLFENKKDIERWNLVNDNVMGGLSKGKISITEDSCLKFSGVISLDNNGGFSSIQSIPDNYNLGDYKGIKIRIKGDGRTYQFRLRNDRSFDGVAYKQLFETIPNEWLDIELPFSELLPTYRGKLLKNAKPLNPNKIKQIGFLIGDKKEGSFGIIVDQVIAYK
jgi:monofunctional biosynthetic peptidoglycan transglycosylase